MNEHSKRWFSLLIPILLVIITYGNTLHVPFFFDDSPNIVYNQTIKDLGNFTHLTQAKRFTEPNEYPMLVKRYVSMLSLALNYRFNGLDTTGYHVVNIIIHIFNSLLVYTLVILTFRTPFLRSSRITPKAPSSALLAAALFAAHPVQTQAVTYIVQRMASLATLFYLSSLASYIQSRLSEKKEQKIIFYVLAIVFAVLAMKSKEIAFTLPLAIALYEWLFFDGPMKKRITLWLPLGLTMLLIPLTLLVMGGAGVIRNEALKIQDISRVHYLLTEARVAVTYMRLLVLPIGQVLNYDYPLYRSILEPPVMASCLLHLAFLAAAVILYMRSRKGEPALRLVAFGVCWFYLALTVESTLVPLYVIFEHRLYLPSVGIFMGVSTGSLLLINRFRNEWFVRAAVIALMAAPFIFGTLTVARNALWQSRERLWEDTVQKAPFNILNHIELGNVYLDEHRFVDAETQFKDAILSKPVAYGKERLLEARAKAYFNLGNTYRNMGKMDQAAQQWEEALRTLPSHTGALNHLGNYYILKGNYPRAIEYLKKATQYDPSNFEALYNLATAYERLGKTDEAVTAYRQFIALSPRDYEDVVRSAREKLRSLNVNDQ